MTVFYAFVQFVFWFSYGSVANFASVYLLDRGISNLVIGLITAFSSFVSILVQPKLATYVDREKSVSIKSILLILYIILVTLGGLLALFYGQGAMINGILLGFAFLIVQVALPFVIALATETLNQGKHLNFSLARGVGSVGYAVMSFALGKWIATTGAQVIPWTLICSTLVLMMVIWRFPFIKDKSQKAPVTLAVKRGSFLTFVGNYPVFSVVLLGCTLIYTSHILINNFAYQIVNDKGGTSEHMGILMGLAGLLEVLTMFAFTRLLKWRGSAFWFQISGVFFTLKCLGTLLAGSMGALYLVQIFQPLGWGLLTVSSVYYVNELMQKEDKIKGHAYMTMTLSIGSIIGSFVGGFLIDKAGVNGMLLASVLFGLVGTVIVNVFSSRNKAKSLKEA